MRNIVGIHSRYDGRAGFTDHQIGTASQTKLVVGSKYTDATISLLPLPQQSRRIIGRGIVQNHKLEMAETLIDDAAIILSI